VKAQTQTEKQPRKSDEMYVLAHPDTEIGRPKRGWLQKASNIFSPKKKSKEKKSETPDVKTILLDDDTVVPVTPIIRQPSSEKKLSSETPVVVLDPKLAFDIQQQKEKEASE